MTRSMTSLDSNPFSMSSASMALVRSSASLGAGGWLLLMLPLLSATGWRAARAPSGRWLQVALPQVEVDALIGLGRCAPQLRRLEADGVQVLRVLAAAVGVGVGEDIAAVVRLDNPGPAARVGGRPGRARGRVR